METMVVVWDCTVSGMGGKSMPANEGSFWITLLGNFGFPIVVSTYLLMRFEKKLENLTTVVQDLKEVVRHHEGE